MHIEIVDIGSNTLTKQEVEELANNFTVTFGEVCSTIRFKSRDKYFQYLDCSVQQIHRGGEWVNVLLLELTTAAADEYFSSDDSTSRQYVNLYIHLPDLNLYSDLFIHALKHSYEIRVYTPEYDVYDVHSLEILEFGDEGQSNEH